MMGYGGAMPPMDFSGLNEDDQLDEGTGDGSGVGGERKSVIGGGGERKSITGG